MRVAVNTRMLLPGRLEGIGYFTQEICRRLPDLLPEAELLYLFDRPYDPSLVAHPRVSGRVVWPPTRDPLLWKFWFDYRIPRQLNRWEADVFFCPDGYVSLRTPTPQVIVIHDLAFLHFPGHLPGRVQAYYEKYVPRFLYKAREIITVSDFVKQDVHRQYGVALDKLTVVGNGVKEFFRPLEEAAKEAVRRQYTQGVPYFFYLGSVHPRKNIDRLIQAYGVFRRRSSTRYLLLLGGRLAWQAEAVRLAYQQSEYRADIRFLDYLPETEAAELLAAAAALVYPSLSEGFGVPLLEAMHAEVPILTGERTSLPEVAGSAALYFDPESVEAMATAMHRIVSEAHLAASLITKGRQQRERYSWDRSAAAVAAVLRQVNNS